MRGGEKMTAGPPGEWYIRGHARQGFRKEARQALEMMLTEQLPVCMTSCCRSQY